MKKPKSRYVQCHECDLETIVCMQNSYAFCNCFQWVQCDKCEKWQHQVCALFNMRRNEGGQAEYTCPHCLIGEVEKGERKPLPQSAVLGAKDLPRTLLSDHIEQRLARKLKHERLERARDQGKSYDEVIFLNKVLQNF